MQTLAQLLSSITTTIVPNGNNDITADVLRPILVAIAEYIDQEVGNREDLETTDQTNIVAAINELIDKIENAPSVDFAPVPVLSLTQDYFIARQQNRAILQVLSTGVVGGVPITITVPNDVGTTTPSDPQIGMFFDFYMAEAGATPVFNLESQVEVLMPEGETLVFLGLHTGIRLIKVAPNTWRMIRLHLLDTAAAKYRVAGKQRLLTEAQLQENDTVIMTELANSVLLIHGDYRGAGSTTTDPEALTSYNPDTVNYFDRLDI